MTKCQTTLLWEKNFHRFFGLISTQNHSNRKIKIFWKKFFFEKFGPKITLLGSKKPKFWSKWLLTHFIDFLAPKPLKMMGHMMKIAISQFSTRFGTVRPKSWKTGFFEPNRALSVFFNFGPLTSGQKLEKSLEPFSRKTQVNTIFGYFGPFWDR
jgi:hypothetical protein